VDSCAHPVYENPISMKFWRCFCGKKKEIFFPALASRCSFSRNSFSFWEKMFLIVFFFFTSFIHLLHFIFISVLPLATFCCSRSSWFVASTIFVGFFQRHAHKHTQHNSAVACGRKSLGWVVSASPIFAYLPPISCTLLPASHVHHN